jgi:hypothetical protein
MTPAETITAAVKMLREDSERLFYTDTTYFAGHDFDDAEKMADALLRLLPLAELSPGDLRTVIEMAEAYMLSRVELFDGRPTLLDITPADKAAVSKLRRAADALEGRGA